GRRPMDRIRIDRRPAVAAVLFVGWIAFHVGVAWDGGRILLGVVPDPGRWSGPASWALYTVVAVAAVTAVGGWWASGLLRRQRPGWLAPATAAVAAGARF